MYDVHWWALQEMVENGSAKDCYLRYNSNLSRVQFGNKNLYEFLPQFKDWMMCASIDGTGEIVEYIRTGIKWDQWLENFKQGCELPNGRNKMVLDLTITAPGMFSIKDLFDLSNELGVKIETKITFAFHPDIMWSPTSWPREILDEVVDDLLDYIKPRADEWRHGTLIANLEALKYSRKTHEEEWPDKFKQGAKNGKNWIIFLEKIRKSNLSLRDIYSRNSKLLEWWDNI
jgi:hypothetical protein